MTLFTGSVHHILKKLHQSLISAKQEEAYFFHDDVPDEEISSAEPGPVSERNGEDEKV
jgi:hypothetical protein